MLNNIFPLYIKTQNYHLKYVNVIRWDVIMYMNFHFIFFPYVDKFYPIDN